MTQVLSVAEVVGGTIEDLRETAGVSQAEMAAAMRSIGLSWVRQTVAKVEEGQRNLTIEELVAVAAYFDMPVNVLLFGGAPGLLAGPVRVGDRKVEGKAWLHLVLPRGETESAPSAEAASAIDVLFGKLDRPWSRAWRKRKGHPAEAFAAAWEEKMAERSRHPGPIFVVSVDEPVLLKMIRPPWGRSSRPIKLRPNDIWVARDRIEAEELQRLEAVGRVRRISRREAYRLRQNLKEPTSTRSAAGK